MPILEMPGMQERQVVSSGFRSLDRLLPRGGISRGSLVEWLADDDASGATTVAIAVAVALAGSMAPSGTILVVDRAGRFHPPAVMPWLAGGAVAPSQCIVARPARDDDEVWVIDQALRCPGVTAVLAWPRQVHPTAMRRWQLASRSSQTVGLLVRPGRARRNPSWAMHRIVVASVADGVLGSRRLRLSLLDGPWSNAVHGERRDSPERSVDVAIDLVRGRETVVVDRRLDGMPGNGQLQRASHGREFLLSQGGAA